MRISLEFAEHHSEQCRARLGYAFAVFCAIYGHESVAVPQEGELCLSYRDDASLASVVPTLRLSDGYRARPLHESAPPPLPFECDGEETVLHFSCAPDLEPDWLAEIFEWLSCADEYSVTERDAAGRIPFAASYTGRHGLDPKVPYAAVAMRGLQRAICRLVPACPLAPPAPVAECSHLVVNTHDVDFLPVSRFGTAFRLAKNGLIALAQKVPGMTSRPAFRVLLQCQPRPAEMLRAFGGALAGRKPLDEIHPLLEGEQARQVGASYYFIVRHQHRRDANYQFDDRRVRELLRVVEAAGQEIGVHGSYCSLLDVSNDAPDGLPSEFDAMRQAGFQPQGGRQHWLRCTLDRLIPAVESAGARYDCSLGWFNTMGYRAGACFAFPPYNFAEERAARFLEIPLVMMEQCLCECSHPEQAAQTLLDTSRRYGWGGVSVLWHPAAFGGGQLPAAIGEVYWKLLDGRRARQEEWMSASNFLDRVEDRYINAGLTVGDKGKQWQRQEASTAA